jgi:ribosomal protein L17
MNTPKIVEQNGARVLTTQQLAEAYGTDNRRISENFNANKSRYTEGKHYFLLQGDQLKKFGEQYGNSVSVERVSKLYIWTEKGAWLQAKSLNTDEAWEAYEMLVDDYYTVKQQVKVLSEREQLMASMRLSLETAEEITQVKGEVKEIRGMVENQITLDYGEQLKIKKSVGSRVYEIESEPTVRSALFRELYRDIKDRFGVASYRDIKRKDILSAINYINAWIPRKVTQ